MQLRRSSVSLLARAFTATLLMAGWLQFADLSGRSLGNELSPAVSCDEFLVKNRLVRDELVGQDACRMRETVVTDESWPEVATVLGLDQGRKYRRLEIGISGTLDGYAVKDGPRLVTFTSAPDFVFPQGGNTTEPQHGVLRYEMLMGSGMSLLYPEDGSWNGKLWLTLPGMGSYRFGTNKSWDRNYDPAEPVGDITKYEKAMLAKGYAVAKTRRSHNNERPGDGDYFVRLFDGTVLLDRNPAENPELVLGYAQVAQKVLEKRLGREPARTYWYGHSGGGRLGRLVNYNHYRTKANAGADGTPIIDGLLVDDSAAGLWLPQVFRNGEDILFRTEEDRRHFVPMLEVNHQLYMNDRADPIPEWVSTSYYLNKLRNAKILHDKGLGEAFRMYEVRGVSHIGGETLPNQKRDSTQILPLWYLMESFIEILDTWVDRGTEPPPTKSDWVELGDTNGDGVNDNQAIALPEVACPLGVYYPFPPGRGSRAWGHTAFAPFDGEGEEPMDGRATKREGEPQWDLTPFADMNRNGFRDLRETVTQAWRRLGLLEANETFSRDRYVACVQTTVSSLAKEGLLSGKVVDFYVGQARTEPLPEWVR